MNSQVIVTIITGLVTLLVAGISVLSARSAQKISEDTRAKQQASDARAEEEARARAEAQARAEVEAQAYVRARESYERIVRELESQLDRNQRTVQGLQDQMDRVLNQLSKEQDTSNHLRNQIRAMQDQIRVLQQENEEFRRKIAEHGRVADQLRTDLHRAGLDGT
jgi:predicted RNase H-like nuclease (RuvC/YqgF family)